MILDKKDRKKLRALHKKGGCSMKRLAVALLFLNAFSGESQAEQRLEIGALSQDWTWTGKNDAYGTESAFLCAGYEGTEGAWNLTGAVFAFSDNSPESQRVNCEDWAYVSLAIINGEGLDDRRWIRQEMTHHWEAKLHSAKINFLGDGIGLDQYGWYTLFFADGQIIQEATFGPPVRNMPSSGTMSYTGTASYNGFWFRNDVRFAVVDFNKMTAEINATVQAAAAGEFYTIQSDEISVKSDGFFTGEIRQEYYHVSGNRLGSVGKVSGYIGGDGATNMHLLFSTGGSNRNGVDFFFGSAAKP